MLVVVEMEVGDALCAMRGEKLEGILFTLYGDYLNIKYTINQIYMLKHVLCIFEHTHASMRAHTHTPYRTNSSYRLCYVLMSNVNEGK